MDNKKNIIVGTAGHIDHGNYFNKSFNPVEIQID